MGKMVTELIDFLQKWGLWQDVTILAGGKAYFPGCNKEDVYCGLPNVKITVCENPEDYTTWDPLVFDTWEEYQEFVNGEAYENGEEKLTPAYQRYGTYEEYLADMEISESLSLEDIKPVWEQMISDAKTEFIRECAADESGIITIPEIAGYIKSEFDKIFDRYGLWYDFGFAWSLTCYKKE